jgi:eukaryotic-like serine/threonine-protein kinase
MSRSATEQPRAVWCCSTCGAIYHKDFPRCPADGAEVVRAERDPLLGASVGHYTIDELLGEGGMGRVYLAHHTNLPNKRYAFKVLLGDHAASTMMRARFTREAERASQLDHPNVVKVVDFGQTAHGLLYIVMDFVDGPSLVSLIGEVPMPPAQVISLARAICKGLVYAHAAGIVHRDLKPENILVSTGPDGAVPRLVDFGLAMSVDQSDARLTESGMTMGTPAFAAPEQLAGKPIDHRADLFALGMTMFEMLTGGLLPFEGHIMEVVSAKTTRDAPRISVRVPGLAVPAELEDIVERLTRRKPAERFASAREVIEALDAVHLGPEARMATEIGEPLDLVEPRRRRWKPAALVAAAAAAFALAGGYAFTRSSTTTADVAASRVASPAVPAVADRVAGVPVTADPVAAAPVVTDPVAVVPAVAVPAPVTPSPTLAASDPEIVLSAEPTATATATPTKRRHRPRATRPPVQVAAAAPVALIAPVASDPAVPPPGPAVVPPPPPPPLPLLPTAPPAPRELRAHLDAMDVSGSLSAAEVQRAIERRWPAITRCAPGSPGTVVARFTIGEARRARDVRAVGPAAQTNACVVAAFTEVRTEAAPDVGDVQVTVRIAFVVKT